MIELAGQVYQLSVSLCGSKRVLVVDNIPDRWGRVRVVPLTDTTGGQVLGVELVDGTQVRLLPGAITPLESKMLGNICGTLDRRGMECLTRSLVLTAVEDHFQFGHAREPFKAGQTAVPVSGRNYDESDVRTLVDSSLDFWLTTGRYNDQFEKRLAKYLGVKHLLTVNSGSSANLLALASLTSHRLSDRALKPGDEVITVAAGFPTTVNPSLLYGLVPVFVDVDPFTYNALHEQVAAAVTPRTRAIMLAHTLGNPFDVAHILQTAKQHNLWLIEDCCDALGSRFDGRLVGTFGHLATFSFYPAHHITMGEGGAVATNDPTLKKIVESMRDWGRDCWCDPGKDNTCRKRFDWQHGNLPAGYDHKYVYSHVGYNLKITDMQAAVGCSQLDHLSDFIESRKRNFKRLHDGLTPLSDRLILPEATPGSDPSWFGFPITLRAGGQRRRMMTHLQAQNIDTRLLFAGNVTRQPYFEGQHYRINGELPNSDKLMSDCFWVGVYPGLTDAMIDHVIDGISDFFKGSRE